MKEKKPMLGTIVHSVKDFRALKAHNRFVTPYFYISKISQGVTLILFVGGFIGHNFFDLPMTLSVIFLVSYLGSLAVNFLWFDHVDHRVYVGEDSIAVKYDTITKKYKWTEVDHVTCLSDRAITVAFIDGSTASLKNIRRVDELLVALRKNNRTMIMDQ
jgi:hypothetical protein